ncbi:hypothetical protein AA313_de0204226 [Arthrobotrys entomopaga]|nr:hypothetical protein AA313_de0204226 [Arthrobotrys entomopaga]
MFIGLCGTICAGKHTVAKFLVETYGFKVLRLAAPTSTPLPQQEGAGATNTPTTTTTVVSHFPENDNPSFSSVDELLDYVTPRWQERWVTTEIWSEDVLEALLKRPFFMLVSVDAPVIVRWQRYIEKYTYTQPDQLQLKAIYTDRVFK